MKFRGITIGVPREIMPGERRVSVTPQTAKKFVEAGARLLVETGAGKAAFFVDEEYLNAGAEIVSAVEDVYKQANLVLKVKEPQMNSDLGKHEIDLVPEGAVVVGFLHPAHRMNHEMVREMAQRNITGFTLDGIPRISRAQQMDALTSMSTVAGYKAALIAAHHLARFIPMMPTAFGLIQPARFLVVGIGVAGLQAIATAKRLGAKVKALDIRPEAKEQARSLGAELVPFDVPQELAVGKGGYALRLPKEWAEQEMQALAPHVAEADAVILTALIPGEEAPVLVSEPMIKEMKKGSVVVDIAIDQGGNCALTKPGTEYMYEDIVISGFLNVPATLPVDSTRMFAENAWHFLNHIIEDGKLKSDLSDEIIQKTLVTKDSRIVHQGALLAMGLR